MSRFTFNLLSRAALVAALGVFGFQVSARAQFVDLSITSGPNDGSGVPGTVSAPAHSYAYVLFTVKNATDVTTTATGLVVTMQPAKGLKIALDADNACSTARVGQGNHFITCDLSVIAPDGLAPGQSVSFVLGFLSAQAETDGFNATLTAAEPDILINNIIFTPLLLNFI